MDPAAPPRNPRISTAATIERIRASVAANIDEIPTLAELASNAGMSRYRLSRMFRKHVGTCLRDYVRNLRLECARQLLAASRQSITATALECGFYDLSHFDRVFRRHFGVTPREFRARHAKAPSRRA